MKQPSLFGSIEERREQFDVEAPGWLKDIVKTFDLDRGTVTIQVDKQIDFERQDEIHIVIKGNLEERKARPI